ncbi:MAG TPA: efflux RND transporter permease subunit [Tepidisphaeraceae bacterium]|nr:efflux RND transporter permease subunit [Tepidisphaeraceae bacterium]
MRTLADICIRRPVFASMLILALVVVGAAAYGNLGVDRLPSVDLPSVTIRTTLPGASPEEVETEVSQTIEENVNTVEGIEELRSVSGAGTSFVIVTFGLDRDIDVATQDVRDRIASIARELPDEVEPPIVSKFDNDSQPVLTLALSGSRTMRELTELADKIVKVQLERSVGVGEVEIRGGLERTINVWADSRKLAAYNLPITALRDAITAQNAEVPGGNVTGPLKERALRTMGRFTTAEQFNDMVVATVGGTPIRVRDVGRAEDGTREVRSVSRLNGQPTVGVEIRRQTGANTIEVIEAIKAKLVDVRNQMPPGVEIQVIRDQSSYIYAAQHEINVHLVLGAILACLVVLAFMRSWRSTIIAGVAIPASVISTYGMMWALDFTLNSVTMLALVLMVGIVIDDAIVVLENIYRFLEEKKLSPMEAARQGTAEIALAVLATTLSLVVIFVPVSFMSSISGRFLYQFGITAAVSVMVSLLVSFTLTPMMSARLLRSHGGKGDAGGNGHGADSRGGFYGWIDRAYTVMLQFVMRHRIAVSVLAVLVVASAAPLYKVVPVEFTPGDVDEGEFQVTYTTPEGTAIPATDEVGQAIEAELRETRGVQTVLGTSGAGFAGAANGGDVHVGLIPHEHRYFSFSRLLKETLRGTPANAFRGNFTQRDVVAEVRQRLRKFKDVRAAVRPYASFNIGGGNFEVDFVILGPELEKLDRYAEALRQRSPELGLADIDTTLKLNKPELRVDIDRDRAADLGVSSRDIGTALRLMVGGDTEVSRFRDPATNEDYDVQLRLEEPDRTDPGQIPNLFLPRKDGGLVELQSLASMRPIESASRIDRLDRQRTNRLRGAVAPGYALGDRLDALRGAAAELNMPPAYTYRVSGRGRELERTFKEFLWAFLLSVIFMYMILASNYESLVHPLTILLSLPLSIPFALLSLWATGGTLNLYSALGILVLFGVVKKNSILQIDHMNHLREDQGRSRYDAIIQGHRDRLRPILMTTLCLVAAMLPLALGTGPGAEERRAVAIVVIGGQTLSLLLTLLVTPVAYSLFDDARNAFLRRRRPPSRLDPGPRDRELASAEAR